MRIEEAKYIGDLTLKLTAGTKGLVLNLGSSTEYFRKVEQAFIHKYIFAPLENTGVSVIHSDLKDQEGVDISGDIFEINTQRKLRNLQPSLVLVCNLMEHLQEDVRRNLPFALDSIIEPGGVIIITVPHSYPLHLDPIDSYYRPSPQELSLLFSQYDLIDSNLVVSSNYYSEFQKLGLREKLKIIMRVFAPFYRPRTWLCVVHRFFWLFRPYMVSCVTVRKRDV